MTEKKIALLPGDGIGPEVVGVAHKVLLAVTESSSQKLVVEEAPVGGAAYDLTGEPLPQGTLDLAKKSDAILLGAVGGPKWESLDYALRPERALLGLRAHLNLFANLRPAVVFKELAQASTLKHDIVSGVDLLVVRELTGGIYFGEPRSVTGESPSRVGLNSMVYSENEVVRIAKVAFETAQKRRKKLCSVDKANVLQVSELWRDVVESMKSQYSDVEVSHMYVDNAAMQLVKNPKQFDVILTGNLFGDILSDIAAMLTGSIGLLPSASLNESQKGMYEPVHGSAPDIAGQDLANPIATVLSTAMMLRLSLGMASEADRIEKAVQHVIQSGYRTPDLYEEGATKVGCAEMGHKILESLDL